MSRVHLHIRRHIILWWLLWGTTSIAIILTFILNVIRISDCAFKFTALTKKFIIIIFIWSLRDLFQSNKVFIHFGIRFNHIIVVLVFFLENTSIVKRCLYFWKRKVHSRIFLLCKAKVIIYIQVLILMSIYNHILLRILGNSTHIILAFIVNKVIERLIWSWFSVSWS